MEEKIKPIRDSWEVRGCTLLSDGWTDRQSRPLVNTLACCPQGVIHLSTIDCMNKTKSAEYLFQLLRDTILSIGEDKVVQVVTDNASNCARAGELLMKHFPKKIGCLVQRILSSWPSMTLVKYLGFMKL